MAGENLATEVETFRGSKSKVKSVGSFGKTAKSIILTIIATYGPEAADYIYGKLKNVTNSDVKSPEDVERVVTNGAIYDSFALFAAERGVPPTLTVLPEIAKSNPRIAANTLVFARLAEEYVKEKMKRLDVSDDQYQAGIGFSEEQTFDFITLIQAGQLMVRHFGSLASARAVQTTLFALKSGDWDDLEALITTVPSLR